MRLILFENVEVTLPLKDSKTDQIRSRMTEKRLAEIIPFHHELAVRHSFKIMSRKNLPNSSLIGEINCYFLNSFCLHTSERRTKEQNKQSLNKDLQLIASN